MFPVIPILTEPLRCDTLAGMSVSAGNSDNVVELDDGNSVELVRALTPAEEEFCLAVIQADVEMAYKMAFGDQVHARAKGMILLGERHIADRVTALRRVNERLAVESLADHLDHLARIRNQAEALGMPKAAYQCERSRGEALGFYIGKTDDKPKDSGITVIVNPASPSTAADRPIGGDYRNTEVVVVSGGNNPT